MLEVAPAPKGWGGVRGNPLVVASFAQTDFSSSSRNQPTGVGEALLCQSAVG